MHKFPLCGEMAPEDERDLIEAVVTCEGNLHDPDFSDRFQSIVSKLKSILYTTSKKQPLKVRKIEPWNSVRVTISIPKEAAQRLRLLAQQGSNVLRQLGILSVQVEGDQVISLTLAGRFNEPQEVILRQSNEGANTSASATTSSASSICSTSSSAASTSLVPTPIVPVAGPSGVMVSLDILSSSTSSAFRSPNVVAPSGESIPFPPKNAAVGPRPTLGGPFPFASMTHAAHTMQRSETSNSSSTQIPSVTNSTNSTPAPTSNNANAIPSSAPPVMPISVTSGSLVRSNSTKVTVSPSTPPPTLTTQPLSAPGRKNNNNNNVNSPNVNVVSKPQPVLVTAVVNVKNNNSSNNNSNNGSSQNNGNNSTNSSFIPPSNPPNVVVVVNSTNFSKPAQVQGDAKLNPSQQVQHLQHHHSKLQTVLKTSSTGVTHSLGKDKEPTPPPIGPHGNPQLTSSGKPRQFLINPLTGHLEPMPSESSSESEGDEDEKGHAQPRVSHVLKSKGKDNPTVTAGWDKLSLPPPKPVKITLDALKLNRLASNPGSACVISRKSREDLETTPSLAKENSIAYVNNTNPVDKIKKLRLKIEKTESLSPASYKMDVAYVKKSEKSSVSTVMSSSGASASLGGQFSANPSSSVSSGLSSTPTSVPSQSDVPRVPPLHISLRGKNAAVVVSPRRDENKDLPNTLSTSPTSISPSCHNDNKPIVVSVSPQKSTSSASRAIKRTKIRLKSSDGSPNPDESVIIKKAGKNIQPRPVPATTNVDEREDPLKARLKSEEKFNSSALSSDFGKVTINKSASVSDLIPANTGAIVNVNAMSPSSTPIAGVPPKVKKHRRKSEILSSRQVFISSQSRDKRGELVRPSSVVEASQLMKLLSQQVSIKDEEEFQSSTILTPPISSLATPLLPSSLIPCESDKERETSLLPSVSSDAVFEPSPAKLPPSDLVTATSPLGKDNDNTPKDEHHPVMNSALPPVIVSDIPKHNEDSTVDVEMTSKAIPDTQLSKSPHEKSIPDLVALPLPQSSLDSNKPEVNTSQSLLFSLSSSTSSHPPPQHLTTAPSATSSFSQPMVSGKGILTPVFTATMANSPPSSSDGFESGSSSTVTQSAIVSRSVSELVMVNPMGKHSPIGSGARSIDMLPPLTSSPSIKPSVQSLGSSILNQMLTAKEPPELILPGTSTCKVLPTATLSSTASLLVNPVTAMAIQGNLTTTVSSAMLLSKVQVPSSASPEVLLEEEKSDASKLHLSKLDSVGESSESLVDLVMDTSSADITMQELLPQQPLTAGCKFSRVDDLNISKSDSSLVVLGPKIEEDSKMEGVVQSNIGEKQEASCEEVRIVDAEVRLIDTKVPVVLGDSEMETDRGVVISSPTTVMAAPNVSSSSLDPLPLRLMALSLPSTAGLTSSSSSGGKPEDQSGIPGEDSGIDSMDALSEKSPNQGESPARKNENDHHFCDNSTSHSHSQLHHPKNSPASDRSTLADFDSGAQVHPVEPTLKTNLEESSGVEYDNCRVVGVHVEPVPSSTPASESPIVVSPELKNSDPILATTVATATTDTSPATSTADDRKEPERETSPIRNKVPLSIPSSVNLASSASSTSTLSPRLTCPEEPEQEPLSLPAEPPPSSVKILESDSVFDSVAVTDGEEDRPCMKESAECDNNPDEVSIMTQSPSPVGITANLTTAITSTVGASPGVSVLEESPPTSTPLETDSTSASAVEADHLPALVQVSPLIPQEELSVSENLPDLSKPSSDTVESSSSPVTCVGSSGDEVSVLVSGTDLIIGSNDSLESPSSSIKETEAKPETVVSVSETIPESFYGSDGDQVSCPVPIHPDVSMDSVQVEHETQMIEESGVDIELPIAESEEKKMPNTASPVHAITCESSQDVVKIPVPPPPEEHLDFVDPSMDISSVPECGSVSTEELDKIDIPSNVSVVVNTCDSLPTSIQASNPEPMDVDIQEHETKNVDQQVHAENPVSSDKPDVVVERQEVPELAENSAVEELLQEKNQLEEDVSQVEINPVVSVNAVLCNSDIDGQESKVDVTLISSKPEELQLPAVEENIVPISSIVPCSNNPDSGTDKVIEEPEVEKDTESQEDSKRNENPESQEASKNEENSEKVESKSGQDANKAVEIEELLVSDPKVKEETELTASSGEVIIEGETSDLVPTPKLHPLEDLPDAKIDKPVPSSPEIPACLPPASSCVETNITDETTSLALVKSPAVENQTTSPCSIEVFVEEAPVKTPEAPSLPSHSVLPEKSQEQIPVEEFKPEEAVEVKDTPLKPDELIIRQEEESSVTVETPAVLTVGKATDSKFIDEPPTQHEKVVEEVEVQKAAIVPTPVLVPEFKAEVETTVPVTLPAVASISTPLVLASTTGLPTATTFAATVVTASGNAQIINRGVLCTTAATVTTTSPSSVNAKPVIKPKDQEELKVKMKVDASTSTRAANTSTAAAIIYPSKTFACLNSKEDSKEKVQAIVHPAPNHSAVMMLQSQLAGDSKLLDGKVRPSSNASSLTAARSSRKDIQLPVLIPAPNPLRGESQVASFHAQGKPQMPNITPMQKVKIASTSLESSSLEMTNSTKSNSLLTNANETVSSTAAIAPPPLAPILIRPNFQSPISFTLDQQHGKPNQIPNRQSIEISLPPKVEVKPNVNINVQRGVPNVIKLTQANLTNKGIAVTGAQCLPVSKSSPISVSLAPLTGSAGLGNASGTPTVFAIHPHQYHHQSAITVLPSGHKMVPIKLVTIPKQNQAQLPLQSVVGSNRSSPTILEHVNLVAATSRSSSPNSPVNKPKVHGNAVQSSPLNLSSVTGGNLHLVPISVSTTSVTGTASPVKVLVSSPMKMQPNLLQSMMVKGQIVMANQNQTHHHPTTIRVVRPLLSQDLDPPKLEPLDNKSQLNPHQPRGLVVETVSKVQQQPLDPVPPPVITTADNSDKNSIYERSDGVQILDTEDTNEDELYPFEADIIHDEKDLADVLADENVRVSENGIDLDSLDGPYDLTKAENESSRQGSPHTEAPTFHNYPHLKEASCHNSNYSTTKDMNPDTTTAASTTSGSSDDAELDKMDSPIPAIRASSPLYTYSNRSARNSHSTSESRSPSPPEPDVHGEDQEIIDCLSRSPSQPKLSPQNKPLSAVENDNDYGSPTKPDLHPDHTNAAGAGGRDNSSAPQLEQLSIEIPPVDLMAMSPAATEDSRKHTRSTRSNTRLVSPDITAFRSDTPKPTKFTNKPDALVLRNSPKPSPTGSIKTHSPGLGGIQPSTSARASPVPNQLTVNSNSGIHPITGRNSPNIIASSLSTRGAAGATAFINKRKRQESDSSNASKDENSEENKVDMDLNSRPGKRRCSENAAELIKACIGVEDTPKRNSSLIKKMELQDNKAKDASNGKGKKPMMSVVLEETEDDLESVDLLSRGRSGGRSSRGSSEDRSSSRGSSVHRNTGTPKPNAKEEENKDAKGNSRVNNRTVTVSSKEVTNKTKGSGRDSPSSNLIKKDETKQSSVGRRSNRNAPTKEKSPLTLAKTRTNFRKEPVTSGVEKSTTPSTSPENGNPRRKTRSSVAVGASDSMPTFKRRRISKDAKS